jgi:hypothetical protein
MLITGGTKFAMQHIVIKLLVCTLEVPCSILAEFPPVLTLCFTQFLQPKYTTLQSHITSITE